MTGRTTGRAPDRSLKLLLVGPCPPPHGGISVHVATAHRLLEASGAPCRVLDVSRDPGNEEIAGGTLERVRRWSRLCRSVRRHARDGWTLHFHTNGHNPKSWLVALACGVAARSAPGRVLTLHSGMVPEYLEGAGLPARTLVRTTLGRYQRILCVNRRIEGAVAALGVPRERLEVAPAYLPAGTGGSEIPTRFEAWLETHRPVLVATLSSFDPEYGVDVLLDAVDRLTPAHPGLGCLVLGGGGGEERSAVRRSVRSRGLEEHLLLPGDVAHSHCLALMARADLFVRPTLADGDALSVREALDLGLPVVATDTGNRPAGVETLARPGDPEALAAAVHSVLERRTVRPPTPKPDEPTGPGTPALTRLLQTYREVAWSAR